ncbi:MAG: tyrosine-type recombinase/integrase [Candidatus Micrarchaeota archaeon]|nr:tyrosine-type recombinase/integrase [Candidatus Micrarchaeota archaeon]
MGQLQVVGRKELMRIANRKPPKFLYPDDIRTIINGAQKDRYRLLFLVLWMTGARISEALSLRYCDIDWREHQIRMLTVKQNDLAERMIPIQPELETALSTYITTHKLNPNERLFKMTPQAAHLALKHVLRRVMLPKWIHLHTFRHSFAVNCLRNGVLINTLKVIMGHRNIEDTMIYLTVFQPEVHKQISQVKF